MPGVAAPTDQLPSGAKWAAIGVVVLFVGIAVGQHPHPHRSLAVSVAAAVITIALTGLMGWAPRPLFVGYAVAATVSVTVLCHGLSSSVGWLTTCVLAAWLTLAAGRSVGIAYAIGVIALFGSEWIWAETDPGWGPWMVGVTFTTLSSLLVRHELALVAQLRAAQASLAETARAEERNRIARELHDVIAHTLVVSQLHVASARLAVQNDPSDAVRSLAEAERLGRESLAEVRRAVGLLRDGDSDGLAPLPGAADVPALAERFQAAGTDVALTVTGELAAVSPTAGLALYRVLQEALTNAVKHAGGWPVTVAVDVADDRVGLLVETGAPPGSGTGVGLSSMSERAASVGGRCTAGPGGRGWQVRAELPGGGAR
jgi:signal transduction histidine kinase